MIKEKSYWFQRFFIGEITGEVKEKKFVTRGREPVTLYTIAQEGIESYCASMGYQPFPKVGDRVKIYTKKRKTLANDRIQYRKENSDGSVKIGVAKRKWSPIKTYEILEE